MRLKEANSCVDVPGSRLQTHNVVQRNQNRNQPSTRDKLPDSGVIHCRSQWADSHVTSPNTTACATSGEELHQHLTNSGSNFNNNITATFQQQQRRSSFNTASEFLSESSPDDSLGDSEDGQQSSSSVDVSPQGDEYRCFSHEELSDSDSLSDDGRCQGVLTASGGRGIVNPNYPGFQHLAHQLHPSDTDDTEEEGDTSNNNYNNNNNNNNGYEDIDDSNNDIETNIDSVNHLDSVENFQKAFYDKPKFNIPLDSELDCCCVDSSDSVAVLDDEKDLNVHLLESGNVVTADSENVVVNTEELESDRKVLVNNMAAIALTSNNIGTPLVIDTQQINCSKMSDAFLSSAKEDLTCKGAADEGSIRNKCGQVMSCVESVGQCTDDCNIMNLGDSNRVVEEWEEKEEAVEKFNKEEQTSNEKEKEEDSVVPRKKEKMEINCSVKKSRSNSCTSSIDLLQAPSAPVSQQSEQQAGATVRWRDVGPRGGRDHVLANRRSVPTAARDKKRSCAEILGGFDVYNIETAMPKIDLDAIESHLRAAREEERRRRNDREEIRRRLAMGSDTDEYYGGERPGRKPSLQARLQSGMNLQICFMNDTVSDTESPGSDTETASPPLTTDPEKIMAVPRSSALPMKPLQVIPSPAAARPSTSLLTLPLRREPEPPQPMTEADFFARQAQLQAEARLALAQAKEMAHMQMEVERQRQKKSPITEMVRSSLEKVGIPFPEDRRRVSRQILTEMNVAQLQVIVNDLHTQIEILNESLVKFLMDRDDLHMEQDSMLVDIEDLTRYLGAKEQTVKKQEELQLLNQNNNNCHFLPAKPKMNRVSSLVKK